MEDFPRSEDFGTSLLKMAIEFFELDPRSSEVGSREWVWLKHAYRHVYKPKRTRGVIDTAVELGARDVQHNNSIPADYFILREMEHHAKLAMMENSFANDVAVELGARDVQHNNSIPADYLILPAAKLDAVDCLTVQKGREIEQGIDDILYSPNTSDFGD